MPMPAIATTRPEEADAVLREALEASGQRFTEQRAAVYRFLRASTEHPSADEVFTAVRGEISDISLATVYKALETLVSCNLAVKLAYADDSARYDARTDDHYHARCTACGQVRDVPGDPHEVIGDLRVGGGFRVRGFRVEVVGLCAACADA
jgi:Fur family peroxide stress response transcriptional regulator